jgi:phosphopantetheine--protein transferase-like protein
MILVPGLDAVDITRFNHWHTYSATALSRLFSPLEVAYCKEESAQSAQRFAVRFAAKEALYKALYTHYSSIIPPLLTLVSHVSITKHKGCPLMVVDWDALDIPPARVLVSLTHTKLVAVAYVLIMIEA